MAEFSLCKVLPLNVSISDLSDSRYFGSSNLNVLVSQLHSCSPAKSDGSVLLIPESSACFVGPNCFWLATCNSSAPGIPGRNTKYEAFVCCEKTFRWTHR